MNQTFRILLALGLSLPSGSVLACASCGCSINSDWGAQGLSSTAGWSLDLRYDALDQNRLWAGSRPIAASAAAVATNPQTQAPAEVELSTRNRYLTATLDYSDGSRWGLSLALPYLHRTHGTLGSGSDGSRFDPAHGAYTSDDSGPGDMRLTVRYFGFSEPGNLGLQLGLKLPSGGTGQVAAGGSPQPVDPGLQLGTGTTDLIVGGYYFGSLPGDWSWFTQAAFQAALKPSTLAGGSYRPGNSVNATLGARYRGFEAVIPSVQINARVARADSGDAADTFATGGRLVYLTLGLIVPVSPSFAPYLNLQLPVYQNVNGIQLTPRYAVSVGAKLSF